MTYRGYATFPSGEPMPLKTVFVRASIFYGTDDPVPVYTEEHETFTDAESYLTIRLGEGNRVRGHLAAINWGSGNFQLQVSISDGENFRLVSISPLVTPANEHPGNTSPWQVSTNRLTTERSVLLGSNRSFGRVYDTYPLTIVAEQALPRFPNRHRGISLRDHREQPLWHFNLIDGKLSFTAANIQDGVLLLTKEGNVGLGTTTPRARLHLPDGDVYLEAPNHGVIMTSPNGQCWRMTVSDEGEPRFEAITCPE